MKQLTNESLLILDLLQLLISFIGICTSLFFILTVKFNRAVQTLSNVLTCNSSLAVFFLASDMFVISLYILNRDLSSTKINIYNHFFCYFHIYISHINFCALIYSFVIQTFQRLISIVYYNRLYYQSLCPYLYAIIIQWCIAIIHSLPIIFNNHYRSYIEDEYLCRIRIDTNRMIFYICSIVCFIPLGFILIQYCIAVIVSQREKHRIHTNDIQRRARHQMKFIGRIFILVSILIFLSTPYYILTVFDTILLIHTSKYAYRIGLLFLGLAIDLIMLMTIYFTRNIKCLVFKEKTRSPSRSNTMDTLKRIREALQSETACRR